MVVIDVPRVARLGTGDFVDEAWRAGPVGVAAVVFLRVRAFAVEGDGVAHERVVGGDRAGPSGDHRAGVEEERVLGAKAVGVVGGERHGNDRARVAGAVSPLRLTRGLGGEGFAN